MKKLRFLVSLTTNDNDYQIEQAQSAEEAARKLGRPGLTADAISEIHVSLFSEGTARIIRLVLDGDWKIEGRRIIKKA